MSSRYQHPLRWAGEQIDIMAATIERMEARIAVLEAKPKRGRPRKKPVSEAWHDNTAQEESLPMD